MKTVKDARGFIVVTHEGYVDYPTERRLVQESSAVGDYDDSFDIPGSSYLWVGDKHHLNREEVQELVEILQHWLSHKTLRREV
jgi:hypothetical protein